MEVHTWTYERPAAAQLPGPAEGHQWAFDTLQRIRLRQNATLAKRIAPVPISTSGAQNTEQPDLEDLALALARMSLRFNLMSLSFCGKCGQLLSICNAALA